MAILSFTWQRWLSAVADRLSRKGASFMTNCEVWTHSVLIWAMKALSPAGKVWKWKSPEVTSCRLRGEPERLWKASPRAKGDYSFKNNSKRDYSIQSDNHRRAFIKNCDTFKTCPRVVYCFLMCRKAVMEIEDYCLNAVFTSWLWRINLICT